MNEETNSNNINDTEGFPAFHKPGSTTPFKANDDYFQSFADKMQDRVDAFEEIRSEAPLLSEIPKYNPFEVPENYFDALPHLVQEKCIAGTQNEGFFERLILLLRPKFAIPAFMLILIAATGIYYINKNGQTINTEIAEENTVEAQLQNIDEATILEALTAEVTSEEADTENDNIVDYLIDNNIDENSLNNDL